MKKSIWVIEEGTYSDYHVVGVFSSEKNAEAVLAKLAEGYEGPTISEWALDPGLDEMNAGLVPFSVIMLRDGAVEKIRAQEWSSYTLRNRGGSIWRRTQAPAYQYKGIPDALCAAVFAKDEKHAVKIANEMRVQMIASGEWES